jgi:hypothetical protein
MDRENAVSMHISTTAAKKKETRGRESISVGVLVCKERGVDG